MIYWELRSVAEHASMPWLEPPRGLLSAAERAVYDKLRRPKRREEWLFGRYVAKELCRAWLALWWKTVPASSLSILPGSDGAPRVFMADGEQLPLSLTLSHRAGRVLVAVAEGVGQRLGADLEIVEPRSEGFAQDFFTAEELRLVEGLEEPMRSRVTTEIWSTKEAVLKALHLGLTVDTRTVSVSPRGQGGKAWTRTSAAVNLPDAPPRATVWARDHGIFVLTLVDLDATLEREPSDALRKAPSSVPESEYTLEWKLSQA